MAYVTRIGLANWPQVGDTIRVYTAGDTPGVDTPLQCTDIEGGSTITDVNGDITVPNADFLYITPPDNTRVDIYWVNGTKYLVENVIVFSDDIPLLVSDPVDPYTGQKWINTTDSQLKFKTSTGTVIFNAFQYEAD